MRREDVQRLSQPYSSGHTELDERFPSALEADIPHARALVREVFNDLSTTSFGISWWATLLPDHERILISDYLYQCVNGIELNLVEAKLHYLEWLDARDKENDRIADMASINDLGQIVAKAPPALKPMDEMPNNIEKLHVCGFFRAIGSSFDCLGSAIIGVLGLKVPLRKSDINKARDILKRTADDGTPAARIWLEFRDQLEELIKSSGPEDWLEWSTQYRNMFVHRGRRLVINHLTGRKPILYDIRGYPIPRMTSTVHLAKYPDKSDIEAMILGPVTVLNEDAEITLSGVFKSSRELLEAVGEGLVEVWKERRQTPVLISQPISQWNAVSKPCGFKGYKPSTPPLTMEFIMSHPILYRRMLAASADDSHRPLWNGSKWES